ncbi:MAG: glycosyltransferase family 2 protein [Candidatus Nanopelagicales bacterium]|nr:glycosyltransferase family 2 protein [Candidatus Nanopelagicales bacterium]
MTQQARPFAVAPTPPRHSQAIDVTYGRLVVGVVFSAIFTVTCLAAAIGEFFAGMASTEPATESVIDDWHIWVSHAVPPKELIFSSLFAIAFIAAAAVTFEIIGALLSVSPTRSVLARYRPKTRTQATKGARVRVTVLIPAHNEESSLPVTLSALELQTRKPDRVIVVSDNSSDLTSTIPVQFGYECFETHGNEHKKGGALNQVLAQVLPESEPIDVILVMDADTSLGSRFIEVAAKQLEDDPELTAVGGVFFGENGHGLIGQFQRNEYARYSLQIRNRRGRVFVLTGTATMFRAEALLDIAAARGVYIPGEPGRVYDTAALTEDNELTLALKSLGATMTSPRECTVTTELMPTWRNLWVQRQRWQRGALENLSAYGFTRATLRYWGQQVGIGYGAVALNASLALMFITICSVDHWIWFPFWLVIGLIFVAERVITAWSGGWKARLLALALFPELFYDVYLQVVFIKCLLDIFLHKEPRWGHVQHSEIVDNS